MAEWLNLNFYAFDRNILEWMHGLAENYGEILTPLMKFITLIGEKGLWMFALAAILMCFSKTRKIGVCLFGAVACGALITNIALKDQVARLRPFEWSPETYGAFWQAVGSPAEDGFSFPSGHVTAAMAGITALTLAWRKKWMPISFLYVIVMAFSRNYLMAHFPTDVIAAVLVGAISGIVAWFITKGIYYILEKYQEKKFFSFLLNFDLIKFKK